MTTTTPTSTNELEKRLAYLKSHNQTLENEKNHLNIFKNQIDQEIERVIKNNSSYCYLTLDDIDRFEVMMAAQQEALVVVNAPYDTDIEVYQVKNNTTITTKKKKVLFFFFYPLNFHRAVFLTKYNNNYSQTQQQNVL
jgi:predicted RNA-binding protein with EMAP domain